MRLSDLSVFRTGPLASRFLVLAGLAAAYFVAGTLGLRFASVHPSATPVWAPTGIALAAILVWGGRVWPAVFVGAFLVNLTTAGNVATSATIALGNTLEAVLGAYFVRRFSSGRHTFDHARDAFAFLILAGGLATTVSATIGVSSLALGGFAPWADVDAIWLTWWLGDAAGALVVAPVVLLWANDPRIRWPEDRKVEAAGLIVTLLVLGQVVFGNVLSGAGPSLPIEFLAMPVLVWAATRFTPREAATATLALSAIALHGTLLGTGPFARGVQNESLLLVQSFLVIAAGTTLILAAIVAERRRASLELQRLSESDGLTGLANYRHFHEVLTGEISRFGRTGRPLALLLLDLNDLKAINDKYGHLTGNRALIRIADALRGSCRAMDTAARFGGDEFAVVLPETDAKEARAVANRVAERLKRSEEDPPLALSFGIAECPGDGTTPEALLERSDRALYEMKRGGDAPARSHHAMQFESSAAGAVGPGGKAP